MLTLQQLKDMPSHTVFAHGETVNSPEGINMSNDGRTLHWVAKRGEIHDWAIYIGIASWSDELIKTNGDKVTGADNIKKLVPCDDEAYEMYRR
jgi:hypothetical protein